MSLMEFLSQNKLVTTTMLKVDSGSALSSYLFNRNKRTGWSSVDYTGATKTSISIEFAQPTVLSHLLIQNHNLKDFRVFYDSVTANSIVVTSGNSQTSTYISFNSTTVSSIQLQIDAAMTSAERTVGEIIVTERELVFERNPSVEQIKQNIYRKQIEHEMPDGGIVLFNIRDKYHVDLSWQFITSTFRDSLLTVFERARPIYYLHSPTTTSWNGVAHETNWVGGFNFDFADNVAANGYSGGIALRETPGG